MTPSLHSTPGSSHMPHFDEGAHHSAQSSPRAAGAHSPNGLNLLATAGRVAHTSNQSQHSPLHSSHEEQDGGPAKKKQKTALSCSECKRRKIKCSRTDPCEHCLKRKLVCSWDEAKIVPEAQPFALSEDLLALTRRMAAVELFLQSLPPALRAGAPEVGLTARALSSSLAETDSKLKLLEERTDMSDTEDAALELETQVFSAQPNVAASHSRFGGVSLNNLNDRRAMFAPTTSNHLTDRAHGDLINTVPCLQVLSNSTHRELTAVSTSILAPPCLGPPSAAATLLFGLDFAATVDECKAARVHALEAIVAGLPDRAFSEWAIARYFIDGHWMQHCVQKRAFVAEHDRFWEMRAEGRVAEVDPMWLAVWVMVLGLTIDGWRSVKDRAQLGPAPPGETDTFDPERWCWLAQKLMVIGDWQGRPQIRSIQCTLLFGMWSLHASTGIQPGAFHVYFAGAIKTAQILGLHALGDDPERMPPVEDPAWPVGKNSMKREGALHVWAALLFFDWLSATPKFPTHLIDERQCTTAPPSNVNEDELSSTEWQLSSHPLGVATDASFSLVKRRLAEAVRLTYQKLISPSASYSYEAVLELDGIYRQLLDDLPLKWQHEHRDAEKSDPALRWSRNIATESIHSRIVRLHRPFLTRGFDPKSKYRYSSEQAIKSARIVVTSHHNNLAYPMPYWFLYSHSLGASIVLFCDLFNTIDSAASSEEVESRKDTLVLAMQIFATWEDIAAPALAAVVQTGSRIISGLFMAVERRRTLQLAGAPVKESFAQVLTRISQECAVRAVRSPLVSPALALEPDGGSNTQQALQQSSTAAAFEPAKLGGGHSFDVIPALGFSSVLAGAPFNQFATTTDNMYNPALATPSGALPQTFYNFFAESGFPSDPTQVDNWGLHPSPGAPGGGLPMSGLGAGLMAAEGGQFAGQQGGQHTDTIDWGSLAQAW